MRPTAEPDRRIASNQRERQQQHNTANSAERESPESKATAASSESREGKQKKPRAPLDRLTCTQVEAADLRVLHSTRPCDVACPPTTLTTAALTAVGASRRRRHRPAQSRLRRAPGLAHICAGTCPHLRRDPPTSAPGPAHIGAGTRPHLAPGPAQILHRDPTCRRNPSARSMYRASDAGSTSLYLPARRPPASAPYPAPYWAAVQSGHRSAEPPCRPRPTARPSAVPRPGQVVVSARSE